MPTIAELVRARAADEHPAILFEDRSWSYAEYVTACAERAALLAELRRPGPFHVGVLLDNVPEFAMWLGAAAVAGAVVVGINPTRRGAELARDITHTECQLLVTEGLHAPLLDGVDTGVGADRTFDVESAAYAEALDRHRGAALSDVEVSNSDLYLLLFTSGTSGAPKACLCSQGRLGRIGRTLADMVKLGPDDVCYVAMPMFHSNALMAGWAPALAGGATTALRRKFSASGFLPDVRKFGVTYFNYVGKPLSYVLATPERPDDADNSLRLVFGNEGADLDIDRFSRRFGVPVIDSYGSTEGGAIVQRTPDMPPGALGRGAEGMAVLDPETGEERPPGRFDADGRLLNPDEAIGELVNRLGATGFEGYWNNDEANTARVHDGIYWTGDLAYRDEQGYFYFAGRDYDWLRVDGENFAAAPVERILARHPEVVLAAVYAVPDPDVGDRVMAALQLRPGATFDPEDFAAFLAAQPDLGTKWTPRFVRIAATLPVTETSKVLKRVLRRDRWETDDDVWWQPEKGGAYRRLTPADVDALRAEFAARGRQPALEAT
ncbi:MAG TPA: long-chain-fatty-acid--CoA ligase [Acidimicrobiia bacterium]|nr:long-chain-fatty-acid--CoA ligase [Acidimicrobiia bacterium]